MKQKIGLIVDSTIASKQINDLIELSLSSQKYEITTLILNELDENSSNLFKKALFQIKKKGIFKFVSIIFFRTICKLERRVIKRKKKYQDFYKKFNLLDRKFNIIKVSPLISKSGLVYKYSDIDLEKIKNEDLNLLVRNGSGILKGKILTICPNGIISFHHADNDVIRGGPAAFWEVYKQLPKTGFIIQRLTEELDGGQVLYKGFVPTKWFYSLNMVTLYEKCNPIFHRILEDITSESLSFNKYPKIPYSYKIFSTPKAHQTILYAYKTLRLIISKKIRKIFGKEKRWGIAYQYNQNWKDVTLHKSIKIPNPKNRYLADPFLISKDNKHYCFVEDFDFSRKKGSISVYEITKKGYKELGIVLREDFHLSFPYLFEYDNDLYMCPETDENKDIRLYKCLDFPLKWKFCKSIMKNISAADTQIFSFDNKWWLLTNLDESSIGEHSSQLHIFYSNSPLSENWISHKNNPVIFDSSRARNGGLIKDKSGIYRVYQRQGFDHYGQALGVAKILSLDVKNYIEENLFEVEPNFFSNINSTHTYNYENGLLVFDFAQISRKKLGN